MLSRSVAPIQPARALDKGGDLGDADVLLEVREQERPVAAHAAGVTVHHLEARPHQRGQVDLVDYQQVGAADAWPALARDLVTRGDVDHVYGDVCELRA